VPKSQRHFLHYGHQSNVCLAVCFQAIDFVKLDNLNYAGSHGLDIKIVSHHPLVWQLQMDYIVAVLNFINIHSCSAAKRTTTNHFHIWNLLYLRYNICLILQLASCMYIDHTKKTLNPFSRAS
jgi:hypothetical protein